MPFLESGDAVPIVLDTNRADVISIKVADYDQSMDSTNVTIIVQVSRHIFSLNSCLGCIHTFNSIVARTHKA
jgi:hypothetical protein